jgi:metal iron transporter
MQPEPEPVIFPPNTSTTATVGRAGSKFDEKHESPGSVVEVQDSPRRITPSTYLRSARDAFSRQKLRHYGTVLVRFGKFTGPGAIISVAYIDPDNYQTDVSSGVQFEYRLLFMLLVSNLVAIYLQVSQQVSRSGT